MIKLRKISSETSWKKAVWTVVGFENIRIHQIGGCYWLADEYDGDKYIRKIASHRTRNDLVLILDKKLA